MNCEGCSTKVRKDSRNGRCALCQVCRFCEHEGRTNAQGFCSRCVRLTARL